MDRCVSLLAAKVFVHLSTRECRHGPWRSREQADLLGRYESVVATAFAVLPPTSTEPSVLSPSEQRRAISELEVFEELLLLRTQSELRDEVPAYILGRVVLEARCVCPGLEPA